MIRLAKKLLIFMVAMFFIFGQIAAGGTLPANIKDSVLDNLFSSDSPSTPYVWKLTLRYGDSDSQIVIVTHPIYPIHPDGQVELITYTIDGLGHATLSQFIARVTAEDPNITAIGIAAKLKPVVKHSRVQLNAIQSLIGELKAIRIAPMFPTRVAVDEFSEYGFWYDGGQESVHYNLTGPSKGDPQDYLVQWMIKVRANLPRLLSLPAKK